MRRLMRGTANRAMREVASFVHPRARMKASTLGHDRPGQALKGAARTAYEPHTDPHQKELAEFARELMQRLEEEALQRRFPRVAIQARPTRSPMRRHRESPFPLSRPRGGGVVGVQANDQRSRGEHLDSGESDGGTFRHRPARARRRDGYL